MMKALCVFMLVCLVGGTVFADGGRQFNSARFRQRNSFGNGHNAFRQQLRAEQFRQQARNQFRQQQLLNQLRLQNQFNRRSFRFQNQFNNPFCNHVGAFGFNPYNTTSAFTFGSPFRRSGISLNFGF